MDQNKCEKGLGSSCKLYATKVNASFVNRIPYTRANWIQTMEINDDDQFNLRVVV